MNGLFKIKPAGRNRYNQLFFSAPALSVLVFLCEACDFFAGFVSVFAVSVLVAGFAAGAVCANPIPEMASNRVAANSNFFMVLNLSND